MVIPLVFTINILHSELPTLSLPFSLHDRYLLSGNLHVVVLKYTLHRSPPNPRTRLSPTSLPPNLLVPQKASEEKQEHCYFYKTTRISRAVCSSRLSSFLLLPLLAFLLSFPPAFHCKISGRNMAPPGSKGRHGLLALVQHIRSGCFFLSRL